ncbi:MAG: DUF4124 domain-containing protein [Steroidobacteraceae bacterium]
MLRPVAITALLVAGICGVAYADVYRWVDDHGEAHYTDRWVPGAELIKSSKPRPLTPDSSADRPLSPDQNKTPTASQNGLSKQQQQAAEQAVRQDVAKTKEAQCKQAKDRYEKSIEARRLYKPAKDGDTDRQYMTDEEADAYRLQARNDVTLACGSPPAPAQPAQ